MIIWLLICDYDSGECFMKRNEFRLRMRKERAARVQEEGE